MIYRFLPLILFFVFSFKPLNTAENTKNEVKSTDPKLIARWISVAQKSTTIKFFNNPQVAWKFKTPQKIVVDLEKLITKHGNVLAMPAKTQEDKILKQALLDKAKQVGMLVKQKILKDPYKPFFGGDYEGYVVHMPDGSMVKVNNIPSTKKQKRAGCPICKKEYVK